MSAHAVPRLSPEEYLKIERDAEFKSEYYDGGMFVRSGGSLTHSHITVHLAASQIRQTDRNGCKVTNSDLRIQISPRGPFVYPDLTVYCGEPQLADDHKDILLNPSVIFEVLSKSTEAHARGHKFAPYRRI